MGFFEDHERIVGCFSRKETGQIFEYRKTRDEWAIQHGYSFEIALNFGYIRYANILKNVAYVVVDENEFGNPIEEKWKIKQHHRFENID